MGGGAPVSTAAANAASAGAVSMPEHPGFAFVAGQGGSGIETAPALAAFAAAVLTGAPPPPDVPLEPAALAPTRR